MGVGLVLNRNRQVPAQDTPAFAGIAERFRRAGDLDKAVTLCLEGLQRFPDHTSARVTLGWALLDLGRYDEAREALEQALKRAPDNLAAIRGLAELHDRAEHTMMLPMDGPGQWPPDSASLDAAALAAAQFDAPDTAGSATTTAEDGGSGSAAPSAPSDLPLVAPPPQLAAAFDAVLGGGDEAALAWPLLETASRAVLESEPDAANETVLERVIQPVFEPVLPAELGQVLEHALDPLLGAACDPAPDAVAEPVPVVDLAGAVATSATEPAVPVSLGGEDDVDLTGAMAALETALGGASDPEPIEAAAVALDESADVAGPLVELARAEVALAAEPGGEPVVEAVSAEPDGPTLELTPYEDGGLVERELLAVLDEPVDQEPPTFPLLDWLDQLPPEDTFELTAPAPVDHPEIPVDDLLLGEAGAHEFANQPYGFPLLAIAEQPPRLTRLPGLRRMLRQVEARRRDLEARSVA